MVRNLKLFSTNIAWEVKHISHWSHLQVQMHYQRVWLKSDFGSNSARKNGVVKTILFSTILWSYKHLHCIMISIHAEQIANPQQLVERIDIVLLAVQDARHECSPHLQLFFFSAEWSNKRVYLKNYLKKDRKWEKSLISHIQCQSISSNSCNTTEIHYEALNSQFSYNFIDYKHESFTHKLLNSNIVFKQTNSSSNHWSKTLIFWIFSTQDHSIAEV